MVEAAATLSIASDSKVRARSPARAAYVASAEQSQTGHLGLGRWWFTVDRWALAAVLALIGVGSFLVFAASPPVAERLGLDPWHFARRQLVFMLIALSVILITSLLSPRTLRRCAFLVFFVASVLTLATLVMGEAANGARRWIELLGFSLQPSELLKPSFAVVCGWLLARQIDQPLFPGRVAATTAIGLIVFVLIIQPDIGMAILVAAVWAVQMFLAGLSFAWVGALAACAALVFAMAYWTQPHVASRIDRFLDPAVGDNYQIDRAREAFANGGLFGRGPGEGIVKAHLPDAHADFVFAVAGEEMGMIVCVLVVGLYAVIVLRGFAHVLHENNLFIALATAGLTVQFGLQALINMASTLSLIPTKGMTLPFLSYGGSSLLGTALTIGIILAFTRHRAGAGDPR